MFKKLLQILVITVVFCQYATASVFDHPQKLAVITKELPELNSINCRFKQEKTFPNSNVKINSLGNFKFVKGKEIVFITTYPTNMITTYNTSEYRQINDIITAISTKSYSKIEKIFTFYFQKSNNSWNLGLIPKQTHSCAKYLRSIEIQGASYITKIVIITKNSGTTTIWFNK